MENKLLVLDCDGTLLNHNKELSKPNLKALQTAQKNGCKVVLASGRSYPRLLPYLKILKTVTENDHSIAFSGGLVINNKTKETIYSNPFTAKEVLKIYNKYKDRYQIMVYAFDTIYTDKMPIKDYEDGLSNPYTIIKITEDFLKTHSFYTIGVICPNKDTVTLKSTTTKDFGKKYNVLTVPEGYVEITRKNNSKGNAVKNLAKYLKYSKKDIYVFGDAENDISMFKFCKNGVAMQNAVPAVKKLAKYQTICNNDSGVAYALNNLIK